MKKFSVRIPASTANLGPGFDVFGLALGLYNQVSLTVTPSAQRHVRFEIFGEGAEQLPRDETNFVWKIFERALRHFGGKSAQKFLQTHAFYFKAKNAIPLSRGLGSSAAATLSAVCLALDCLGFDRKQSLPQLLGFAAAIEGHPDNIVPQAVGGFCLSKIESGNVLYQKLKWPKRWRAVACVPEFALATKKARAALPKKIAHRDAVQNTANAAFFIAALATKNIQLLSTAMTDFLHESYRAKLVRGFNQVKQAALQKGARGSALSGAGPTILAICEEAQAKQVAVAMEQTWRQSGIQSKSLILSVAITSIGGI